MDELTLDGKVYVSSKRASAITGYAKDYVGQLCREGRVEARQVGRNWYVLETSIREHRFGAEAAAEHEKEQVLAARNAPPSSPVSSWDAPKYSNDAAPAVPPIVERPAAAGVESEKTQEIQGAMTSTATAASTATPASEVQDSRSTDAIVEEMQSAWRDWFSSKPRPTLPAEPEEVLLDTPEVMEERAAEHAAVEAPEAVYASPTHMFQAVSEEDTEVANATPVAILRPTEYSAAASASARNAFDGYTPAPRLPA